MPFNHSFVPIALLFLCSALCTSDAIGQACVGEYVPDGDEMPCGEPGIPCCSEPFACNGPNSPCNNYDPDFQDTGGCDLSCTAGCMDEEAENYDAGADYEDGTCVFPVLDECDAIYNPDSNCDSLIGFQDFLDFLGLFGENFIPPLPANTTDSIVDWNDVFIDSLSLLEWAQGIEEQLDLCCSASGDAATFFSDFPLGTVLPFASDDVPEGWSLCDGREILIADHQSLFDIIGTTFGPGDSAFWAQVSFPATTFNIPDLRGRAPIGVDNMGGEEAGRVEIDTYPFLGATGGIDQHQLGMSELPDLSFYIPGASYVTSAVSNPATGVQTGASDGGITVELGGDATPFSKMQPFIALNYIIKIQETESSLTSVEDALDSIADALESSVLYPSLDMDLGSTNYSYASANDTLGCNNSMIAAPLGDWIIWDVPFSCVLGQARELILQPSSFEGDVVSVLALESVCKVKTADGPVIVVLSQGEFSRFIFFYGEWRRFS